jgi:hypothetical protein
MIAPTVPGRCALAPRIPRFRSLLVAAALAAPVATTPAQQVPEGLVAAATLLPATASHALVIPGGVVTFDSNNVVLKLDGQPPQTLLSLTGTIWGSFLLQTDAQHVLFAHTGIGPTGSGDRLWLVPLQGPPPTTPLATVPFNYDAVLLAPGRVLVSARTGGFAVADNDLLVLDLATGGTQLVATLPGASGPVAIAPNGDILYATASPFFPAPAGSVTILRLPRAAFDQAMATQAVLGIADAQVVIAGLDAASDFAVDDDGDLLFVDWWNGRVSEVSDVDGAAVMVPVVVDYGTASVFPSSVQFVGGSAYGVFEPFQPQNGRLVVFESNYFSTSRLSSISSAPASLHVSGGPVVPAGPFTIAASHGPALGIGVVVFAFGSAGVPAALGVPGFEQPLWLDPTLLGPSILVTVLFDAMGSASLVPTNPGFSPVVAATTQIVFVSATGVLGATNHVPLSIGL